MLWTRWLTVVVAATGAFGGVLVLAPGLTSDGFGRLVYGPGGFPDSFGPAAGYLELAHAVIGAVMVGWAALMLWVVRVALPARVPGAWAALTGSFLLWYVVDTTFSLAEGFAPNAAQNTVLLVLMLPGLVGTRPWADLRTG